MTGEDLEQLGESIVVPAHVVVAEEDRAAMLGGVQRRSWIQPG